MLASNFRSYQDVIIIDLLVEDLSVKNYAFHFAEKITQSQKLSVILNLDVNITVTTSDMKCIEKLIQALKITGCRVCICGLDPINVAVLVNFMQSFNGLTALNIERAIDALSVN